MVLVQVDAVLVEVHVFGDGATYVGNELLYGREERCLSIGTVGFVGMWLDVILMHIAQQRVDGTRSCIEVASCYSLFRLHVDTTHTAFVLLHLSLCECVEQLVLDHRPLDGVGTLLVEITDVLAFEFLHGSPFHLDHGIVNVTHVVLNLHASFEYLAGLVCLRNFVEEGVEHEPAVLVAVGNGEELCQVAYLKYTGDERILTQYDELVAKTSVVYAFIVGCILACSESWCIEQFVLLQILVAVFKRLGKPAGGLIESYAIYLLVNFRQCSCGTRISCNLVPAVLHREHRVFHSEEILRIVTETVDVQRRGRSSLFRNVGCRLLCHGLEIGTHALDAVEDTVEGSVGLWLALHGTFRTICCWLSFGSVKNRLDGVECGLELGSLLCGLLCSLFRSEIIVERDLVLFLVFGHNRVELLFGETFVFELLLKSEKLEDGCKFFFEIHDLKVKK